MNKEAARDIQQRALAAIRELNAIAGLAIDWKADTAARQVRRAVGDAIWQIDREILGLLYGDFPELNDLKDMDLSRFDPLFRD